MFWFFGCRFVGRTFLDRGCHFHENEESRFVMRFHMGSTPREGTHDPLVGADGLRVKELTNDSLIASLHRTVREFTLNAHSFIVRYSCTRSRVLY